MNNNFTQKRLVRKTKMFLKLSLLLLILSGCRNDGRKVYDFLGSGATFPIYLYNKMFDLYYEKTGNRVNYQGIGSGAGVRMLLQKNIDFAGSDVPVIAEEYELIQIPVCIGAVVIAFNLEGISDIKFSSDTVSGIFGGRITRWSDSSILYDNPGIEFPDMEIRLVTRADASGTTYILTDYLSEISEEWRNGTGRTSIVKWTSSNVLSGRGNTGAAGLIRRVNGSIGYLESTYAVRNNIPYASLENKNKEFVKADLWNITSSAMDSYLTNGNVSIVNSSSPNAYPISSFSWVVFHKELNNGKRSEDEAAALVKLFEWMITEGQSYSTGIGYAGLPGQIADNAKVLLAEALYNGRKIYDKY